MEKYELKLFKNNGDNKNFKFSDKKNENIISIEAFVELNEDLIRISYEEAEVKKCGFDFIKKIGVYKDSRLFCCENNVSGFYVEFPRFSSEGTYEIRTVFENSNNNCDSCVVNTFELFNYKKEKVCDKFNLELNKDNRNLKITFNKKFGNVDLSEINLSNIVLVDSKNNCIKNIPCKLYVKFNTIDFFILDVFDDNSIKLMPNEVYSLCIFFRDVKIFSSFSFEYDNINMKAYRVVEKIDSEILFEASKDVLCLRIFVKINSLIDIYDYDYFISNIRNKFLYFKSSDDVKEDTIVFECFMKREKNYFELSICKGNSINIIKFDYDLTGKDVLINERTYFNIPEIQKSLRKYDFKIFPKYNELLLKSPHFGITDRFGQLVNTFTNKNFVEVGEVVSNEQEKFILFKGITILNKFSEIYTIELDYDIKDNFVLSPSVGIKFNKINYDVSLNGENIYLNLDKYKSLKVKYSWDDNKEFQSGISNEDFHFRICDFENSKVGYLKFYDENNKSYLESILINYIEVGSFLKNFRCEKISMNFENYLTIVDKNLFDDFSKCFNVLFLDEFGNVIYEKFINEFDHKFKIYFDKNFIEKSGLYYVKFVKEKNYKISTFFVNKLSKIRNLFLKDFNNKGMVFEFSNFHEFYNENFNMSLYSLIEDNKYLIFENNFKASDEIFEFKFPSDILENKMEYVVCFGFSPNLKREIKFTYINNERNIYDVDFSHADKIKFKTPKEKIHLDDLSLIIKNGYRIFLNENVESNDEKCIFLRSYMEHHKINLKHFIEIFSFEYLGRNNFQSECYEKCINNVLEFLKVKESERIKILKSGIKFSYEDFVSEIFETLKDNQEIYIMEEIFKNLY